MKPTVELRGAAAIHDQEGFNNDSMKVKKLPSGRTVKNYLVQAVHFTDEKTKAQRETGLI